MLPSCCEYFSLVESTCPSRITALSEHQQVLVQGQMTLIGSVRPAKTMHHSSIAYILRSIVLNCALGMHALCYERGSTRTCHVL